MSRLVTKQLVNFPETRKDEEQDAAWLMEGRRSERREIQGRRVETMGAPTLWGAEVSQVRGLTVCELTVSFSGTWEDPCVLSSLRMGTTRLTPAL